jgi:basic amino acid/polyamine antiporter, APA family
MPEPGQPTLVRAIGRWSLAALTINCIIGSGIFGLPSQISATLGKASPFAWIFAAIATALVMACFAEVSSRFDQTGGVYLYSRTAFGRPTGITIAWLGWLARLTAAAANANLFVTYLSQFWPSAQEKWSRIIVLTMVLSLLTAVNYVGVRSGTLQSNLFTAAKLTTLGGFILAALVFLAINHQPLAISLPAGPFKSWRDSILLLVFAYGGYETALMPGGEARNPRRDYPFALFVALVVCTIVYTMTQCVIISLLPQSAMTNRPLATAAQSMFGAGGAAILSVGVLISCYGYLSANVLGFPRILFALAEHGDLPPVMARVHPRFRTPHIAIIVFAVLLYGFSLAGSFQWNLVISAVSRLFYYGSVCAALPVLRRKTGIPAAQFHLPMGNLIAALAVATSLSLLLSFPRLEVRSGIVLAVVALGVLAHSLWASRQERAVGVAGNTAK